MILLHYLQILVAWFCFGVGIGDLATAIFIYVKTDGVPDSEDQHRMLLCMVLSAVFLTVWWCLLN